jgi:3-methyladenine DNA glycosylase AlkC
VCIIIIIIMQLSLYPVAVVPALVQTKQIRINIHKRYNTKTVQTIQNTINASKYYQTTRTIVQTPTHYKTHTHTHTHIRQQVKTTIGQAIHQMK